MSLQWDCVSGILRKAQGSAKKTNNEQFGFAYPLTSGRICSTIIVGVLTLISFVACSGASSCLALLVYLSLKQKNRLKTGKAAWCSICSATQWKTSYKQHSMRFLPKPLNSLIDQFPPFLVDHPKPQALQSSI